MIDIIIILVTFLAVIFGPVLLTKLNQKTPRRYQGVNLSDLKYTEVTFCNEAQEITLAGMLLVPQGKGPFPAVIIIHGSGTSVRDNKWYLTLSSHLQDSGVAVLLPDKRGSVNSEGDWRTSSYHDLATDTLAAVNYLLGQGLVPISEVGIIGLSQGGNISPLVAVQSPDIAFLVNIVGPPLPAYNVLIYEETHTLREMGFLPGISDLIARISTLVLRQITQKSFWDAVGNFEGLSYWKGLTIPALVLYGSEDTNVPSQASRDALDGLDKDNIAIIIYQGSGHALDDPPGQGDSIFRQEALDDIMDFIQLVVGSR
jgi:dipeptidyl aminopeptidase/acylaminoacyl peptidase